ncbi:hypothetical protein FEM33_17550 [Dyadobacter flavalbus]|uniref:GH26 domain-containing protein n=1 Tax=Dyadobacter flavalbus TaxID=2579942 RepID=A0A5M8QWV7_9BACT|nr:hypothetical protein [Dyadobacter flavalbus]KAA6438492.1 hypothetical protein FEM33_17550 [Dyadobacter flavalbus]
MKNSKIFYLAAFLTGAAVILIGIYKLRPLVNNAHVETENGYKWNEHVIGVYDRGQETSHPGFDSLQFIAVKLDKGTHQNDFQSLLRDLNPKYPVLLTIETLPSAGDNILENCIDGDYDSKIKALCSAISSKNNVFYVRWNPEMEVPVTLYPWQYQSSETYIRAFRHFTALCRSISPEIKIVWGTAGYPGADEYWPGRDVVDLISITLNTKSEGLTSAYPPEKDMTKVIRRKILRMRFMHKPVLVLEAPGAVADLLLTSKLAASIRGIKEEDSTIYSFINTENNIRPYNPETARMPLIGVYDPKLLLALSPSVSVEHLFIDLDNFRDGTFEKLFNEVIARNHDVIITFEPWKDERYDESTVLSNTIQGVYDNQFRELYRIISNVKQTVYLRFAHEMEIPIHRYPWQSQDPVSYIKAFRYFMNFNKTKAENIKKVWGPAGDRGSMEWWPGDDVVDYVSMAIYGLPDKNITDPNQQEQFGTIYKRKYHRMRFTDKPVFITEFGVTGPEEFQKKWLEDAAAVINSHREIYGINYFNLADNPKVWGDIPTPVWSISKETFNHFVLILSERK